MIKVNAGQTVKVQIKRMGTITLVNSPSSVASLTVDGGVVAASHTGTQTYGPFLAGGKAVITAVTGSVEYSRNTKRNSVKPAMVKDDTFVDGQGLPINLGQVVGGRVLPRRNALVKGLLTGRMAQQANAADFTSHIEFTFEAVPGTIEVGILNNVAASLSGVRCAIAFSAVQGVVQDAGLLGSLNAGSWVAVPIGGATNGSTIAAASATNSVDNPTVTWSDPVAVNPPARTDGGTLTVGHVRIEIPAANTTVPVAHWTNIGELENQGSASVAPFGRFIRGRSQAVLGVQNRALFTSTTSTGRVVPVLIRYTPRDGSTKGITWAVFGNSLDEGVTANATARRVGWTGRVQRDLSTPQRPIEICNVAIHGAAQSRLFNRVSGLLPQINPEVYSFQIANINSAAFPNATPTQAATDMNSIRGNTGLARVAANTNLAVPIWVTSPPANFVARPTVEYDKLRRALNAEYLANQSSREFVLDLAGPFSGPLDANGQTTIATGLHSDNLHDNDAGAEVWAQAGVGMFRRLLASV